MATADVDLITRILFAETGDLRADPADPAPRGALGELRNAVADQIAVSNSGAGFRQPVEPTPFDLLKPDCVEAWQQCQTAAKTALDAPARGVAPAAIFIQRADTNPATDETLLGQ